MGWEYSEKTKQLFMDAVHGKPGTHLGEIENPDGMGEHGSISCGDAMKFTYRVKQDPSDPSKDVITEAKYLTFGCTSAIASSEALCDIIERGNYTPITALKIHNHGSSGRKADPAAPIHLPASWLSLFTYSTLFRSTK